MQRQAVTPSKSVCNYAAAFRRQLLRFFFHLPCFSCELYFKKCCFEVLPRDGVLDLDEMENVTGAAKVRNGL